MQRKPLGFHFHPSHPSTLMGKEVIGNQRIVSKRSSRALAEGTLNLSCHTLIQQSGINAIFVYPRLKNLGYRGVILRKLTFDRCDFPVADLYRNLSRQGCRSYGEILTLRNILPLTPIEIIGGVRKPHLSHVVILLFARRGFSLPHFYKKSQNFRSPYFE